MTRLKKITVKSTVHLPVEKVWDMWNNPDDIMQWNSADPSWHCPASVNALREGGSFKNRMEARDGSFGFDFEGVYDKVEPYKEISYRMPDGRQATTLFSGQGGSTLIETTFDAETQNDPEMQKQGWQAIMDNFVRYAKQQTNRNH